MASIGIDFGTKYSSVSYVDTDGSPTMIPCGYTKTNKLTLSVVCLSSTVPLVGAEAVEFCEQNEGAELIRWPKLLLGSDIYSFKDSNGKKWRMEAICSLILSKLLDDARKHLNEDVEKVTLTIPVKYNPLRRRALLVATQLAGMPKPHFLEEPVAAAHHYGRYIKESDKNILIYDFGAGTFDVSVINCIGEVKTVIAKNGDFELGGKYIDILYAKEVIQKAQNRYDLILDHDFDDSQLKYNTQSTYILDRAEQWKEELSDHERLERDLAFPTISCKLICTRRQLEKASAELIDKTLSITQESIGDAELTWKDIDKCFLVGGTSQMPVIDRLIREKSGLSPDKVILREPYFAISFGAAIDACSRKNIHDALPIGEIGITVWDSVKTQQVFLPLIYRDDELPISVHFEIESNRPSQDIFDIQVGIRDTQEKILIIDNLQFEIPHPGTEANRTLMTINYSVLGQITLEMEFTYLDEVVKNEKKIQLNEDHENPSWYKTQRELVKKFPKFQT